MSQLEFDHLPADTAARLAWTREGRQPMHHRQMQKELRSKMPVLARALDRMAREADRER